MPLCLKSRAELSASSYETSQKLCVGKALGYRRRDQFRVQPIRRKEGIASFAMLRDGQWLFSGWFHQTFHSIGGKDQPIRTDAPAKKPQIMFWRLKSHFHEWRRIALQFAKVAQVPDLLVPAFLGDNGNGAAHDEALKRSPYEFPLSGIELAADKEITNLRTHPELPVVELSRLQVHDVADQAARADRMVDCSLNPFIQHNMPDIKVKFFGQITTKNIQRTVDEMSEKRKSVHSFGGYRTAESTAGNHTGMKMGRSWRIGLHLKRSLRTS
jgi:hypothetical protein